MHVDTTAQHAVQHALALRYRERRWLVASLLVVVLGLALTQLAEGRFAWWEEPWGTWTYAAVHGLPFFLVHGIWLNRRFRVDPGLLPVVYLLTGIGLMLMLSLSALAYARGFVVGSAAGALVIGAVSFIDTRRAFWRRKHYVWLALALAVAAVLFLAGSGPAGSGARVNLDIPGLGRVQPVEVLKLFVLLFISGYFARNWTFLRALRQRAWVREPGLVRGRAVETPQDGQGDRGDPAAKSGSEPAPQPAAESGPESGAEPATEPAPGPQSARTRRPFVRFALSRINVPRLRDVLPVTAGAGAALASCFLLRDMGPALVMGCTFLLLYGAARGRWVAVAAGFLVMGGGFWAIHETGAVPVVAERMSMLLSPWDNHVEGGEHLAHAYWALASGGLAGVGLGRGTAGAIPAAHTDMVLPAVGEELGFIGLVALLVLYGILLTRALHAARRASGAFGLFLATGAALMILFQLFLIAGGTTGLAPLSGVVTPFVSYGKSSMLVNCVLVGLLASISRTSRPPRRISRHVPRDRRFAAPLGVAMAVTALLLSSIALRAGFVQAVRADDWMVRPALVPRRSGDRAFVYNPRVYEAAHLLGRGTIYDRNGVVLAEDSAGARRYPFGDDTFFLLGDVNRRVKWGASNSLYAEHRYLSYLRGYDNHPVAVPADGRKIVRYDYAELRPLIGSPGPGAARLLARERRLQLTIDVRLQEAATAALLELTPEGKTASVVVLDALTGEVLASATVPLPRASDHTNPAVFDRGFGAGAKPPGSTFKLVTALAALQAEGPSVRRWSHVVHAGDRYARRGEPTGEVDLRRALVSSSNVYFAALSREVVGPERLEAMATAFGFGLPGRTAAERVARLKEPDNLRQAGFGQGPVTASPLEIARVAAAVANGGLVLPVRWLRTSPVDGLPLPRQGGTRVVGSEHARIVADAMRGVVLDERGTAHSLRMSPVPIAGKTGTAEEDRPGTDGSFEEALNHAWFAGFAPYFPGGASGGSLAPSSRRTIAVGVLVENGGHGGVVAAPIAQAVIEAASELGLIERFAPEPNSEPNSEPNAAPNPQPEAVLRVAAATTAAASTGIPSNTDPAATPSPPTRPSTLGTASIISSPDR